MRYCIPLIIFLAIIAFFAKGLKQDPHVLSSALIGKPISIRDYPSLIYSHQPFSQERFLGHVSLLNVWATWCTTCYAEHFILMDIVRSQTVVLYGLNYKDNKQAAQEWLKKYGNPYQDVIIDAAGKLAIDLGVYGTPEMFLIDKKGVIRYKYVGPITKEIWKTQLAPEVAKWNMDSP